MQKIIEQQIFLSIKDFFNELFEKHQKDNLESNNVVEFINQLKSEEAFLNEQGLYQEKEFLQAVEKNFMDTGLYQMFSKDKKESSRIIKEIFENKTHFSSDNTDVIKKIVDDYYQNQKTDNLMEIGNKIIQENEFNKQSFPNAPQYILDLSSKIETHKIKEGLGIVYSVVLNDDDRNGEKAMAQSKGDFFEFLNENIIAADEKVFDYDEDSDKVDVHLCSHRTVFDALIRNQEGQYSILIATNSQDFKTENETAFTHPVSALYVVQKIENELLPIMDGEFESIQHLIDFQRYSNNNRIEHLKEDIPEKIEEYGNLKQQIEQGAKETQCYKGEIIVNTNNNPIFEKLKDDYDNNLRPGPRINWKNHISKFDEQHHVLSRKIAKTYVDLLENDVESKLNEQHRLIEENNNDNIMVKNHFVDFKRADNINHFINDNISLLHDILPETMETKHQKTKSFRNLVQHLNNNTALVMKDMGIEHKTDQHNNINLSNDNVQQLVNTFEKNNLTVRFYGKNQGRKNHAYLNSEEENKPTKESVSYVMGQYTYLDYLLAGKNGVKMDFEGGCSYVENVLLKNTVTETNAQNNPKSQQVIFHQNINNPEYTRGILKTIMNDYIFNADKEKVLAVFNKNHNDDKKIDDTTAKYINSVSEAFWTDFSNKINRSMTPQQINEQYFESCSNIGIKVKTPFSDVLEIQTEIHNSGLNNKAKNTTTINALKSIHEIYESTKLNDFITSKEEKEVKKLFSMGMTQEQIKEIKPELNDDFFENLNEDKRLSKRNKI